jgi:hypothetical protein
LPLLALGSVALLVIFLSVFLTSAYVQGQGRLRLSATQTAQAQTAAQNSTGTALAQSASATSVAQQATQTTLDATAPEQHLPITLPYHIQVPGPCGASNAAWSSSTTRFLTCRADRLTLNGSGATITFTLPSFPTRYRVSIEVSNIVGSQTAVVLAVNGTAQKYGYSFYLGPGNSMNPLIWDGAEVTGPVDTANTRQTNTIGIGIDGSAGRFLLNDTQVYAGSVGVPFATATITIFIVPNEDAGEQADIQNFAILPG